jgi:hypothetical protein
MKTTMTLKRFAMLVVLGSVLAVPALAQSGPGAGGGGMGGGPCMQGGGAGSGMRFNQKNTPGWQLMTQEERTEMQGKMRTLKTYDECKQLQTEHRALMEARAKEKGVTLREPRQNGCDRMKAKGLVQ